jgi:SAM-dependent methyltransferase
LDRVTDSVRAFYEAYPYPAGEQVDCDGYQVELLLSYRERQGVPTRPLQVLEAGCGRGLNLQAAAAAQPHVRFTGIDVNRVAIDEARPAAAQKGLDNLQFQTADLMQRSSLPETPGGYDLILSYGVIHHLSDPQLGFSQLDDLLSPQGLVALMVDGSFGRQPLDRFLQALRLLVEESDSADQRLSEARALARVAEHALFRGTYWQGTAEVNDVEFADRCLHVHERSYSVQELCHHLDFAGLRFLRWLEPSDWRFTELEKDPALGPLIAKLDPLQRYGLIERLFERPKLTLLAMPAGAMSRLPLEPAAVASTQFRLNPQLKRYQNHSDELLWQLRRQSPAPAMSTCVEAILQAADAMSEAFSGEQMIEHLHQRGFPRQLARQSLCQLEADEWLYRPHPGTGWEGR